MSVKRNQRASKHTRLIADKLWDLQLAIDAWDDATLQAALSDLDQLDGSNCWFFEKAMRTAMADLLLYVLGEREKRNRFARKVFMTERRP